VVSEFLRRSRDTPLSLEKALGTGLIGKYRLTAASGASAGNVNALLSSVAWCTEIDDKGIEYIGPENSLHWKVWVETGISRLMPSEPVKDREPAIFDRAFYETFRNGLENALKPRKAVPNCRIPVGLTLTRVAPLRVSTGEGGPQVSVQRMATVFDVKTVVPCDESGLCSKGHLDFRPGTDANKMGRLGALASLSALNGNAGQRLNAVVQALKASSSFPVAFAPVELTYEPKGLLSGTGETAAFTDGGVFDNNPLGLGAGLHELAQTGGPPGAVMLAYSSPGTLRGGFAGMRTAASTKNSAGLGAFLQMVGGAIQSGRDYELQAFLRQLERDDYLRGQLEEQTKDSKAAPVVFPAPIVYTRLATRSGPIVGELFGSFAAFFGRPFREYDFYSGVYDGLEFVARHFICEPFLSKEGSPGPSALADCTASVVMKLIVSDPLKVGPAAQTVAKWRALAANEWLPSTARVQPEGLKPLDRRKTVDDIQKALPKKPLDEVDPVLRMKTLERVHTLVTALRTKPNQFCASGADIFESALCPDGFSTLLTGLQHDKDLRVLVETASQWDAKRKFVDHDFARLVGAPRHVMHETVERALERLAEVERDIKAGGRNGDGGAYLTAVKVAYAAFESLTSRYQRPKMSVNPSSAPRQFDGWCEGLASALSTVAPNYITAGTGAFVRVGRGNADSMRMVPLTFGWKPLSWRFDRGGWGPVNVVLELSRHERLDDAGHRRMVPAWGLSVSRSVTRSVFGVTAMEFGVLNQQHFLNIEPTLLWADGQRPLTPTVYFGSLRLLSDRFYLSLRADKTGRVGLIAGVSDVNGVVGWILR